MLLMISILNFLPAAKFTGVQSYQSTVVTPSSQSNLFPILICLFLIPKEISFRTPI